MRWISALGLAACGFLMISCAGAQGLSQEGYNAAVDSLKRLLADGKIDEATFAHMMQTLDDAWKAALNARPGWDWLKALGEGALTLVAGYFGINLWRGSPSNRKGAAPQ